MDLVCVSHLRWDFVFQRPQHLLTRAARERRVFYIEEPEITDGAAVMAAHMIEPSLVVATPQIPASATHVERSALQARLIAEFLAAEQVTEYVLWVYTPMALQFTHQLAPRAVIYDCMDELAAFAGAPAELVSLEQRLFTAADVVFTGGQTLYEARGRNTRTCTRSRAASTSHTSRGPDAFRPNRRTRPRFRARASGSSA